MTQQEFLDKWRMKMMGMALYGIWAEATQGTMVRATNAIEIPPKVDAMLQEIWRDFNPPKPPAAPPPPGYSGVKR